MQKANLKRQFYRHFLVKISRSIDQIVTRSVFVLIIFITLNLASEEGPSGLKTFKLSIYVLILISILLEKEQNNNDSKCLKFNEKIAAWRLSISLGLDPIQSSLIALSQPNTQLPFSCWLFNSCVILFKLMIFSFRNVDTKLSENTPNKQTVQRKMRMKLRHLQLVNPVKLGCNVSFIIFLSRICIFRGYFSVAKTTLQSEMSNHLLATVFTFKMFCTA